MNSSICTILKILVITMFIGISNSFAMQEDKKNNDEQEKAKFTCYICNKNFSLKHNLTRHIRETHQGKKRKINKQNNNSPIQQPQKQIPSIYELLITINNFNNNQNLQPIPQPQNRLPSIHELLEIINLDNNSNQEPIPQPQNRLPSIHELLEIINLDNNSNQESIPQP